MKTLVSITSFIFAGFVTLFTCAALIAVFSALSGCGTYEVPKSEVVEDAGECGEGERSCTREGEETEGPSESLKAENDKTGTPDVSVSVGVDVQVSVGIDQTAQSGEMPQYIFEPIAKSWSEQIASTPEGYRLASRADVINAIENGYLDEIADKDEIFWTSSENAQVPEMAWLVGFVDDFAAMKTLEFPALYIAQ